MNINMTMRPPASFTASYAFSRVSNDCSTTRNYKHNPLHHHLIERIYIKLYKSVIQNSYKDTAHDYARQAPNASLKAPSLQVRRQ